MKDRKTVRLIERRAARRRCPRNAWLTIPTLWRPANAPSRQRP
jgi:hypothetical protein